MDPQQDRINRRKATIFTTQSIHFINSCDDLSKHSEEDQLNYSRNHYRKSSKLSESALKNLIEEKLPASRHSKRTYLLSNFKRVTLQKQILNKTHKGKLKQIERKIQKYINTVSEIHSSLSPIEFNNLEKDFCKLVFKLRKALKNELNPKSIDYLLKQLLEPHLHFLFWLEFFPLIISLYLFF